MRRDQIYKWQLQLFFLHLLMVSFSTQNAVCLYAHSSHSPAPNVIYLIWWQESELKSSSVIPTHDGKKKKKKNTGKPEDYTIWSCNAPSVCVCDLTIHWLKIVKKKKKKTLKRYVFELNDFIMWQWWISLLGAEKQRGFGLSPSWRI